jgi:LEA14-like dessication related protein
MTHLKVRNNNFSTIEIVRYHANIRTNESFVSKEETNSKWINPLYMVNLTV